MTRFLRKEVTVLRRELANRNRKIAAARRVVRQFWSSRAAKHNYRDQPTAWEMHVALVQLAELLKR